jgi:hypothetical protein
MDKRKKGVIIASIFILSIFLLIIALPLSSLTPTLPGTSTTNPSTVMAQQVGNLTSNPFSTNYPPWWNTSYAYRQEIDFNNTASPYAVVNQPVDVFMSFANLTCNNGTVIVQYWNSTSSTWIPGTPTGIPYQIWNATYYSPSTFFNSFTITFYVNVSAGSLASYFVYYDPGTSDTAPSFTPEVSVSSGGSGVWTFSGQYYNATVSSSINGGKIYISYNNVTGSSDQWSSSTLNQFQVDPTFSVTIFQFRSFSFKVTYTSSGSSNNAIVSQQLGPLFIMYSTVTNLTTSSGRRGFTSLPATAGYVNVTYMFFQWGWTVSTNTTFTSSSFTSYTTNSFTGNNWVFNPQLTSAYYQDGTGNHSIAPFTGTSVIGTPYWFTLYSSTSGEAAGVADLMLPTVNGGPSSWSYIITGTGSNPEQWQRQWTDLILGNGSYITEGYAFYIWNATGGNLNPFISFANGVSVIERQQYPMTITVDSAEYIHYTVNVYVTDYDGSPLANANITVYNGTIKLGSQITNSTGQAIFYLENTTTYTFNTTWNGTTSYETYTNSTPVTITTLQPTSVYVIFNDITTLKCLTQFNNGDPIQNAYIQINTTSGTFVDQSNVNLTGYAVFHITRSSIIGSNYSVDAYWTNGTVLPSTQKYPSIYIDNNTYSTSPLIFTVNITSAFIVTTVIANATTVSPTWGTPVTLQIYWRDLSGDNLSTSNSSIGGNVTWTLNYANGTQAPGGAPTILTPTGSAPNVYYLLTVPSSLLFGGVQYQVYINATASSSTYLPAANQTAILVQLATLNIQPVTLTGPYYWSHSNVLLWTYVNDSNTGVPITSATVTFSIPVNGTSVSGQLSASSPPGNYSYTIPASYIQEYLPAATYALYFSISNTNYTFNQTLTQLVISPALAELLYPSMLQCYYGDLLNISVAYTDEVSGTPINGTGTTINYFVLNTAVNGSLNFNASVSSDWTTIFDSTLVVPGLYIMQITANSPNYQGFTVSPILNVSTLPMAIISASQIFGTVNENLTLSVLLSNTHPNNYNPNSTVSGATVFGTIFNSGGVQVGSTLNLIETDPVNNPGNYSSPLVLSPDIIPPAIYTLEIVASMPNYTVTTSNIALVVQGLPTVLHAYEAYLSDLNAPAVILLSNFGMTENDMPFAFFTFSFTDVNGAVVPNASVSASGGYLMSQGNGQYTLIVPTYGLPPGAYPIVVTGDPSLYGSQQSVFLLQVNPVTVLIPFTSVRVPLTEFLVVFFTIAILGSVFLGYTYVKRVRIPAIIRRIDQLIAAMNRGVRVDVKLIPREEVISRILAEEISIIGVEPRVEGYVSIELADRLVPLLVESGMKENEAYNLAVELKKATPSDREKLLASVGVPGEISETIIQTIEKYEEMRKIPSTKPKRVKTGKETEEAEKPSGENDEESGK